MRKLLIFLVLVLSLNFTVSAQCAMCRASVENNLAEGTNSIGSGLNTGILYLMLIPYLILATIAIAWYIQARKEGLESMNLQRVLNRIN